MRPGHYYCTCGDTLNEGPVLSLRFPLIRWGTSTTFDSSTFLRFFSIFPSSLSSLFSFWSSLLRQGSPLDQLERGRSGHVDGPWSACGR